MTGTVSLNKCPRKLKISLSLIFLIFINLSDYGAPNHKESIPPGKNPYKSTSKRLFVFQKGRIKFGGFFVKNETSMMGGGNLLGPG